MKTKNSSFLKILVISSHYPPYHFGGYELRCKNIMDSLAERGHEILVITSKQRRFFKIPSQSTRYEILRELELRNRIGDWVGQLTRWRITHILGMLLTFLRELFFDLQDLKLIDRQIKEFQPHLIYLGHISPLSRAIMPYLAECSVSLVYDEGGSGLIDSWKEKGIWYKFIEEYVSRYPSINAVKPFIIKFVCMISGHRIKLQWAWPSNMQVFFNSKRSRSKAFATGVPISGARVIYSGIDLEKFSYRLKTKLCPSLVIIVPGRIDPRKGQMDAVRLLARLQEQGLEATMLLVGAKWTTSYYLEIKKEIKELHLDDRITYFPMLTQDKLVELYHQADIFFFPSYQEEGYSRTPLEAMACGCVVISYGNEGSNEIIRDKHTGFLVPPAEYGLIAELIKELIANPNLLKNILVAAREEIEDNCSIEKYIDRIEQLIINISRT